MDAVLVTKENTDTNEIPIQIKDIEYRDSCASSDEEEFLNPSGFDVVDSKATDEDSEDEFKRILEICHKHREYAVKGGDQKASRALISAQKIFESEYYSLPPIEDLNINVCEESELKKFGVVDSYVDFIVKIKPDKDVPHLGFETILFDQEKNPLGEIIEIFGTVDETYYALRFKTAEEAKEKMPVGKEIYYVVADDNVTKPIFPNELAKVKYWEHHRAVAEGSSSEEEVFSDDEAERRYLAKKRQKARAKHIPVESPASAIPKKRKKYGGKQQYGRQFPSNPFHSQHAHWQRQHFQQPYQLQPAAYNNQYPYYSYPHSYNLVYASSNCQSSYAASRYYAPPPGMAQSQQYQLMYPHQQWPPQQQFFNNASYIRPMPPYIDQVPNSCSTTSSAASTNSSKEQQRS